MRGHLTQRGKQTDSWTIVLSLGNDPATGKRLRHWESFRGSKREAEKRMSELEHQRDTGAMARPGKSTVGEYLNRWLHDYVKVNLSPRGYERYESITRVHLIPTLGAIPLSQLRSAHLQKLYASKLDTGLMARTVRYQHVILHKALATALKWGLVSRNVADGIEVTRARKPEMQTWDEQELGQFLEAAKPYSLACGALSFWRSDGQMLTCSIARSALSVPFTILRTAPMCSLNRSQPRALGLSPYPLPLSWY